jgi:1-pyrroline-5-carboxylate dehydrogenase
MNNTLFRFDVPENEATESYAPGRPARAAIRAELDRQAATETEIPLIIGGEEVRTGHTVKVVMPCDHRHVLATCHLAGEREVERAIGASLAAKAAWQSMAWLERASITLKAAELIATRRRHLLVAATMLGQGKSVREAEVDAACEVIDYLRYNAYFASEIYANQPRSGFAALNRMEYRPLEGFVFAVSPFNFTAIASNLNMAVALMGNTTVWKPAATAALSGYHLMKIFEEAGLPPGVVNFVPGPPALVGGVALGHRDLAGVHFTGSNATFNTLWRGVSANLERLRTYPRLIGETGGKDFIFVHPSAEPAEVATAIARGAFEYQGQKCSAASRGYVPRSLWPRIRELLFAMVGEITVGDVRDFRHLMNAVIDERAFDRVTGAIARARRAPNVEVITGGSGDKSVGYYIPPTIIQTADPHFPTMEEELFGPVMTIFVYDDADFEATLKLCDETSPYGLTGAIFTRDRYAFVTACRALRYAAGNFYLNDKPTGAMVGLQPFGGGRGSGTNDKAGGPLNLVRWVSPRTIKETFVPATELAYPYMDAE